MGDYGDFVLVPTLVLTLARVSSRKLIISDDNKGLVMVE